MKSNNQSINIKGKSSQRSVICYHDNKKLIIHFLQFFIYHFYELFLGNLDTNYTSILLFDITQSAQEAVMYKK